MTPSQAPPPTAPPHARERDDIAEIRQVTLLALAGMQEGFRAGLGWFVLRTPGEVAQALLGEHLRSQDAAADAQYAHVLRAIGDVGALLEHITTARNGLRALMDAGVDIAGEGLLAYYGTGFLFTAPAVPPDVGAETEDMQ